MPILFSGLRGGGLRGPFRSRLGGLRGGGGGGGRGGSRLLLRGRGRGDQTRLSMSEMQELRRYFAFFGGSEGGFDECCSVFVNCVDAVLLGLDRVL